MVFNLVWKNVAMGTELQCWAFVAGRGGAGCRNARSTGVSLSGAASFTLSRINLLESGLFSVLHQLLRTAYLLLEAGLLITGDSCAAPWGHTLRCLLAAPGAAIASRCSLCTLKSAGRAELCPGVLYPKISRLSSAPGCCTLKSAG